METPQVDLEAFKKDPIKCIQHEVKDLEAMIAKLSQSSQKLESMAQQQEDELLVQMLEDSVKDMQQHRQKLLQTKEGLKTAKADFISI